MTEIDPFEARFAASLERLADEVPTEVDPVRLTAALAAAASGPRWRPRWRSDPASWTAPIVRLMLVVAAVLALLYGAAVLAPRPAPAPIASPVHGVITCDGEPWATSARDGVTLDCASELPTAADGHGPDHPRQPHTARGNADANRVDGDARRQRGVGGMGPVHVGPRGMTVGGAVLGGHGTVEDMVIDIHLMSGDGLVGSCW